MSVRYRIHKADYQSFLREIPWQVHIVLDEHLLKKMSDDRALSLVESLNYFLCKTVLRRFSKNPIEQKFHAVAVFHGSREATNRHLHVMLYVPVTLWVASPLRKLRVQGAVQLAWLKARRKVGANYAPLFVWQRTIGGIEDGRSVATYVTRFISPKNWDEGDLHFIPRH